MKLLLILDVLRLWWKCRVDRLRQVSLRDWWENSWVKDAIVDRLAWTAKDLVRGEVAPWDKIDTGEWLPKPRRKLGSSR